MNSILVIAPHPDDETLGCGGTLLKHKADENSIHWLIVTSMTEEGYPRKQIDLREKEIKKVSEFFGFDSVHQLGLPTTKLDALPFGSLVEAMSKIVKKVAPNIMYLPNPSDVHSDHRIVFQAGLSCAKWFRFPSVQRLLTYETISESHFSPSLPGQSFSPNSFVDVSHHLDKKIEIMKIYGSELGDHPFPRSVDNIRALATLRGSTVGVKAAEAFVLLKELIL